MSAEIYTLAAHCARIASGIADRGYGADDVEIDAVICGPRHVEWRAAISTTVARVKGVCGRAATPIAAVRDLRTQLQTLARCSRTRCRCTVPGSKGDV